MRHGLKEWVAHIWGEKQTKKKVNKSKWLCLQSRVVIKKKKNYLQFNIK